MYRYFPFFRKLFRDVDRKINGIHKIHFLFKSKDKLLRFIVAKQTSTNSKKDGNSRKVSYDAEKLNV